MRVWGSIYLRPVVWRGARTMTAALFLLAGCSPPDNGLSKVDYKDLLARTPPKTAAQDQPPPPIPAMQPVLAAPPAPTIGQRLVSVSVSDPSVPVRDVLLELARKVGIDLDLDPNITGGVIISARERPFKDVVDRICELANLRYSFKDNVLKVEVDTMVHRNYQLDILNTVRSAQTDISTSTDLSNMIQGSGGSSGAGNTSTSGVKSKSESDAWKEIEDNLKQILANSNPRNQPISSNHPGSASKEAAANPVVAPAAPPVPVPAPPVPGAGDVPVVPVSAPAVSQPAAETPKTAADTAAGQPAAGAAAVYSLNRQAGVVSVFATDRQHKLVKAYFDKVMAKANAQVLIEAKVVEVTLNDQFNTGVDWTALRQNLKGTGFGISSLNPSTDTSVTLPTLSKPGSLTQPFGSAGLNMGFTTFGGDLAMMVNLIKSFGNTRTLSSPRMTVMNNQSAVLKVAENHVYFKLTATVTSTPSTTGSTASQTATYSSQLQTLPVGLVMTVQPSIDLEHNQITLGLRPTVTAWPGSSVSDPAVALGLASACGSSTTSACSQTNITNAIASSSVPVVDVREMESVVTVPSGAVVVMGGLMQESVNKQDSGVPGAADVPVVGNLFKANTDQTQLTELVVFLKATVVHGQDTVDWADRDLYNRYMHDPRPLGF